MAACRSASLSQWETTTSDVRLVLRDGERGIHAIRDAAFAECVVAAPARSRNTTCRFEGTKQATEDTETTEILMGGPIAEARQSEITNAVKPQMRSCLSACRTLVILTRMTNDGVTF